MSSAYIGEIRIFGFTFAPRGWALCNGQIIPIQQNTALFSLLGTTYGGNGTTNFALPNFQGTVAVSQGSGPGLSQWVLGETTGTSTVTLLLAQMAAHNHSFNVTSSVGTQPTSNAAQLARGSKGGLQNAQSVLAYSGAAPNQAMHPTGVSVTGGNQPHNNLMPFRCLNFCIAIQGIFPPRN
jgi:microcystin-dependent protein